MRRSAPRDAGSGGPGGGSSGDSGGIAERDGGQVAQGDAARPEVVAVATAAAGEGPGAERGSRRILAEAEPEQLDVGHVADPVAGSPARPHARGRVQRRYGRATREITAMPDPPKILVLTTFDLDDYVYEALRAGASGFLLKDASAGELANAVRLVAAGDALLAPGVTRRLIAEFARMGAPRSPSRTQIEGLTERESEVLALVAHGMSNGEIARHLVVAEQTVKTHVSRILMKLGLRDRTQMVVLAYETGLVHPGG